MLPPLGTSNRIVGPVLRRTISEKQSNPAIVCPYLRVVLRILAFRYARNYSPKFQAEFGVAEEESDGPFQGFIQRRRQPFGHYVVGFQYPRTDGAHPECPPVH